MPKYAHPDDVHRNGIDIAEIQMPDGRFFERRTLSYRNPNQTYDGVVVTFMDVTTLRLAEMQYRELADSMPNIVWTTTSEGQTDYLNHRWYAFTQTQQGPGEAGWLEVMHEEDLQISQRQFTDCLKTGAVFEMEYRLWDKAIGAYRWFLGRAIPVRGLDGKIKKWVGTAVDIHERVVAEQARRSSERLFQLMANSAPVLVWISDPDGNRTWFNKGWTDFTGQTIESASGDGWHQAVYPDDLPRYVDIYTRHTREQKPFYIEYRLRNQSGEIRWIGARGVPRFNADGEFEGFIGACLDIHEQRMVRDELATSRRRLELMIRTSPSFMAVLSGPDYVITQANDQYLKLVGHRDLVGLPLLEAVPEIRDQGFTELLDQVRRTGQPFVGNEAPVFLARSPGAAPERRMLDFVYQPHEQKDGVIESVFVHGVDVTEKVLARVAIENERENFRNLFKQTPEMVCILSGPEHLFEFVNEAHVRVLGFDATGKTVRQAQPESIEVHGILDDVYRTGVTAELHEIPVTVTNRLRYFNLTYAARRDDNGKINGIMILGTEITNEIQNRGELQKAKLEAEVANQSKTQFLANMSHEIRTPLSAIVGFGELLQKHIGDDKSANSYIHRISRNATHLSRLVDELLDLSKIEADHLEVERIPIEIDSVIEDVFANLVLRARDKGLNLDWVWRSAKPKQILTDPVRFAQILTNVVGNAVKFTERGSVNVEFRILEDHLHVRVIDTGIGLTAEQQTRIFEPFMQADASVTRQYGGTGLGLALSKRLAILLGGTLYLESSEPARGSVFHIEIEVGPAEGLAVNADSTERYGASSLEGRRILVVDDSPDNRDIVRIFLEDIGATVSEAANGEEGMTKALAGGFDMVLMDIQMPIMDGHQAMRNLAERNYSVPVVALTAHAFKEEKDRCVREGFKGYITKPITRANLQRNVIELLNEHRAK